jgi:hypothetical protein
MDGNENGSLVGNQIGNDAGSHKDVSSRLSESARALGAVVEWLAGLVAYGAGLEDLVHRRVEARLASVYSIRLTRHHSRLASSDRWGGQRGSTVLGFGSFSLRGLLPGLPCSNFMLVGMGFLPCFPGYPANFLTSLIGLQKAQCPGLFAASDSPIPRMEPAGFWRIQPSDPPGSIRGRERVGGRPLTWPRLGRIRPPYP